MKKLQNSNRILYLDVLRVIACFLVVMVHISAQHIYDQSPDSLFFMTHASFNALAFSGVTIYIMISGALMLSERRQVTVKGAVMKAIHFYLLFLIWKCIYCIFDGIYKVESFDITFIKNTVIEVLFGRGYYHLWFLPTITILYLFLPLIKKAVEKERVITRYYLIMFFFINILLETLMSLNIKGTEYIRSFLKYNDFYLFTGYIGYYVLGHYINAFGDEIKKPVRIAIYVLALIMLPLTGFMDSVLSISSGEFNISLNTPFSLPSFIMSSAIFLLVKNMKAKGNDLSKAIIIELSSLTLGIYLIHPIIITYTEEFGINALLFTPVLSIIVISFMVMLIAMIPAAILIRIPFIKKLVS